MPTENLFLNTLAFKFPKEPVTFYFSDTDSKDAHFTYLKSNTLFPVGIETLYSDLKNNDTLYTSYDRLVEEAKPLAIDFNNPANYYLIKRYYNDKIDFYLRSKGLITEFNRYSNSYQAWVFCNKDNSRKDCNQYDRFTLKLDFDHFNRHPQLVLSYDRPTLVYTKSVAELLKPDNSFDPFTSDTPQAGAELVKRVLYSYKHNEQIRYKIDKFKYLAQKPRFSSEYAYPIMNRKLAAFIGFDDETEEQKEDNNIQYAQKSKNRYKKYYDKINTFYKNYLDNDDFRAIFPIDKNGFSWVNKMQLGHTKSSSKDLVFGGGATNFNPQMGVNSGPFIATPYTDIKLIFIYAKDDLSAARDLLKYLLDGYKDFFKGVKKYTGKDITFAPKDLHLQFVNKNSPFAEVDEFLMDASKSNKFQADTRYLAIYLTPISKHATDKEARKVYYKVKEALLKYQIASQCIETQKMLAVLQNDSTNTDKQGRPLKNFAYTLQNMAIAINAKLGGTPWRINTEKQNELIVGVGAFKNTETNVQYIGSAFSFDNTGSFNSFEYFQKDELRELAGSIQNAVINFAQVNGKPERLIIHYYKEMSLVREYPLIEQALQSLGLDIPVYIVTIFKTESEDFVLFDGGDNNYFDLMPYSGRYVNLGNKTYLLCNNTRYENAVFNNWFESFPFPVKIKIECPSDTTQEIDTSTIANLIDQVYQFSRIYWKSVKQQNLPVTIKYPEMIAQMMPYFNSLNIESLDTKHLWFL